MDTVLTRKRILRSSVVAAALIVSTGAAAGADVLPVLLALGVILVAAKLGGSLAQRFGQPAVLGELGAGIAIGNFDLAGFTAFEYFATEPHVAIIAEIGVLLLLFEVGLESTVRQMLRTGGTALAVAVVGVAVPMLLGFGVSALILPDATWHTHVFVGATLTATSVGITARVLQDLGRSRSLEAQTILGAAVIDDILGLVVLAVVVGAIASADGGAPLTVGGTAMIMARAMVFLVGALVVGAFVIPRVFSAAARLRGTGTLLAISLAFCLLLSWTAGLLGLAPIIGAFAAGLVLEEVHFRDFASNAQHQLEELVRPIVAFLAPVFFVSMGMRTDLSVFADPTVLLLAGALLVVAVIGKQAASLAVLSPGIDRLTVGAGMIPRGEVGLIFANVGLGLTAGGVAVLSPQLFSALIIVVMATTVVAPPLLKWAIARRERIAGENNSARLEPPA